MIRTKMVEYLRGADAQTKHTQVVFNFTLCPRNDGFSRCVTIRLSSMRRLNMMSECKIDRNQPLDELIRQWPSSISVFIRHDIHCVGCTLSHFHCLRDAARLHNIDEGFIVREIVEKSKSQ